MLKRVLFRAAAVVAVLALGGSAKADFIIDNFVTPNPATQFSLAAGAGSTFGPSVTALPGGVTRSLTVTQTVAGSSQAAQTTGYIGTDSVGGPALTLNTNTGTTANALVSYVYSTAQNLSAGGTSLQFSFSFADLNTPYSVRITDSSNNTSTQSGIASSGAGIYSFSTGSFAGVNLSAVTGVLLSLNRNLTTGTGDVVSADIKLADVRVLTPTVNPPSVPAPPAAVLVLAALPVLGLARARRLLPV